MLIQFSVSNYSSLKNEVVLSMSAGKDTEHENCVFEDHKEKILPSVAVYGPNAAGKSNIFKALAAAIVIIRSSSIRQINDKIPFVNPFLFDKEKKIEPTNFDFIFTTKKGKYQYGFSLDSDKVYEEYLYKYESERSSLIFERSNVNEYEFMSEHKKNLESYIEKNTDNKLFLATATAWNSELTKDAYMWFAESIDSYERNGIVDNPLILEELENAEDSLNNFMRSLLKNADINIFDYNIESKKIDDVPIIPAIPEFRNQQRAKVIAKQFKVITKHEIKENNNANIYELPLDAESEGTKRLFFIGPIIKQALDTGKTIVIDELDNSLHPLLMDYIIDIFNNKESNPNGAQLIFNTHSVNLLSLDKFRRDQIYFVEKDNDTGVTELYSLDEFSARETENIRKQYLLGRYGAIPEINNGDLL